MRGVAWFSQFDTNEPLEQGVILEDFEYLDIETINSTSLGGEGGAFSKVTNDVIILTQSCDLVNDKIRNVHVCPIRKLSEVFEEYGYDHAQTGKKTGLYKEFKKQAYTDKYMTNVCRSKALNKRFYGEHYVLMFDQAVVVSNSYVREFTKKKARRLMLAPPYREAMAQAYGYFFMRVGNPTDMEDFDPSSYPYAIL